MTLMLKTVTDLQPFPALQNCLAARPGTDTLAVLATDHRAVLLQLSDAAHDETNSHSDTGNPAADRDRGGSGPGLMEARAAMHLGFGADNGVCCSAWTASGTWLAVGTAQQLHLYRCGRGGGDVTPVGCTQLRFTPKDVAVTATAAGKVLLAAGGAIGLALFEAEPQAAAAGGAGPTPDWQLRRVGTLAGRLPVCATAFGGRGNGSGGGAASLAAACLDGSLFIWDLRPTQLSALHSRLVLQACAFGQRVTSLAFSSDCTALAVAAWGGLLAVFRKAAAPVGDSAAPPAGGVTLPAAASSNDAAATAPPVPAGGSSNDFHGGRLAARAGGGSSNSSGGANIISPTMLSPDINTVHTPGAAGIPLHPAASAVSESYSTAGTPAPDQAAPQASPESPSKRCGRRRKLVAWQVLQAPASPGTGTQWSLASIAEGDAAPLRPEAAPPTLLAWLGRAHVSGGSRPRGQGAAETAKSLVVCRRGGLPMLCSIPSASQDLELEPLLGVPQASTPPQPHSSSVPASMAADPATAVAAAAATDYSWSPAPMSVADWNAATVPEQQPTAAGRRAGGHGGAATAGQLAQRVWPVTADAASDVPGELAHHLAGLLRPDGTALPPQQGGGAAQQAVTAIEDWNAFSGAHTRCRRAFPCPADAPRPALVRGLAVCGFRSADNELRRGVAWLDAAGVLSIALLARD